MNTRKYLIDVNLPYYFSIWNTPEYIHQNDIGDDWSDEKIWDYAMENNLTIISKDADFSSRILIKSPPLRVIYRVIHIRLGNMKIKEHCQSLSAIWIEVLQLSEINKLVNVFKERIEGIIKSSFFLQENIDHKPVAQLKAKALKLS